MSSLEVTGGTEEEIAELEEWYYTTPKYRTTGTPFEEAFCLYPIRRQPEDYDGPKRYCRNRTRSGNPHVCKFHPDPRKTSRTLEPYANLKHSMYALPETIRNTLSDEEQDLLDWVLEWPEVYDIDLESDPSAAHDFDTLALEIVRQSRSSDYLLANTEITTEGVYTNGGQLLETKEVPNRLIREHQSQIRLVQTIKESLGITQKSQTHAEQVDSRTDVMDSLSTALSELLAADDTGYDPEMFDDDEDSDTDIT